MNKRSSFLQTLRPRFVCPTRVRHNSRSADAKLGPIRFHRNMTSIDAKEWGKTLLEGKF